MKIVNTSSRVVCISGKYVLPGDSISVSDEIAATAGLKAIVKVNGLTFVDEPKTAGKTEAKTESKLDKIIKAKKAADAESVAGDNSGV